ncbi:hypothetical protein [Methylocystis iwaonis]|uniref:Uncharacterized protein n=1 Tax=Methylocystis iwaonis TaxID=2885079 RepID=A0ABM8EE64_9HYPH|nr:hypothetical protein [Methylocystis iwaonis]BDV36301.1 hypothetical protein SS37A_38310 [Methylocystis iwaonis]
MTDAPDDSSGGISDARLPLRFQPELSEREFYFIGNIVAQWGFLEHEIFSQTVLCFADGSQPPKELHELQFTKILTLWESYVVSAATGDRKAILQQQLVKIRHYKDFRDALIHGMWDYDKSAPEQITTTRARKKQLITVRFTAYQLQEFAAEMSKINAAIQFPGGFEEYAAMRAEQGSFMSRRWIAMMSGNPVIEQLFPEPPLSPPSMLGK